MKNKKNIDIERKRSFLFYSFFIINFIIVSSLQVISSVPRAMSHHPSWSSEAYLECRKLYGMNDNEWLESEDCDEEVLVQDYQFQFNFL